MFKKIDRWIERILDLDEQEPIGWVETFVVLLIAVLGMIAVAVISVVTYPYIWLKRTLFPDKQK